MRYSILFTAVIGAVVHAAYQGDIVQYCTERPLDFQRLAVSHAAHDALLWTFHGARLYAIVDSKLKAILSSIGLDPTSDSGLKAIEIRRNAAKKVVTGRADDGINNFVDYTQQSGYPGVYQQTPSRQPVPDTPQAQFLRPWAGVGDIRQFRPPPPPSVNSFEYESILYDTETAYFWLESSPIQWNRIAQAVVGNSLATDVPTSAKFYAQLNYALSNAAIASWDPKYFYNAWRPVTAIQRKGVWLSTGLDVSDPNWTPLLRPTPNHQDYQSTHATFGGAAAAVIRAWNGGDTVDVTVSSNVTLDNRGVITSYITNLTAAAIENGNSRVFGGIHFQYSSDVGRVVGDTVAQATLAKFDEHWQEF